MPLTLRQLGHTFVAEVRGLDLRRSINRQTFDEIYQAFLDYGVLVIPGQALSIDQHVAFATHFGDVWQLPNESPSKGRIQNPAIDDVSNLNTKGEIAGTKSEKYMFALGNQLWHSDLSFNSVPAQASLLHAEEIALNGGETEFADMKAAFAELPEDRKSQIDGLIAEHSLLHSRKVMGYEDVPDDLRAVLPPAQQPLVRIHPDTGEKILFLGAHAYKVGDLSEDDSQVLIEELLDFATQDKFVFRHRWAVNDLVVWDNRRVVHRGRPYDADTERRVMHRVTIEGLGKTVENGEIVVGV